MVDPLPSTIGGVEDYFPQFVYGIWGCEHRRMTIIQRWFKSRPNNTTGTRSIFLTFITNIIKDPIQFKIDMEKVWFFQEENLTIPLSWFSKREREYLALLVRYSSTLFEEVVDLPSGDFILQKSIEFDIICSNTMNRLLILRDFALLLLDKSEPTCKNPRPELFLHLLIAVRSLVTFAYVRNDFCPKTQWTKRLIILNKVLKAKEVRRSLQEIEIFF